MEVLLEEDTDIIMDVLCSGSVVVLDETNVVVVVVVIGDAVECEELSIVD